MENDLKSRLLSIRHPLYFDDWYDHPQAYLQDCGVSASDAPQLIALMHTWLNAADSAAECGDDLQFDSDEDTPAFRQAYLPVTAWRCLAHLGASEAADVLMRSAFQECNDLPEDDCCWEDCRYVIGLAGADFLPRLQAILLNRDLELVVRMKAMHSVASIARFQPDCVQECVDVVRNALAEVAEDENPFFRCAMGTTLANLDPHCDTGSNLWTIEFLSLDVSRYGEEIDDYFFAICEEFYDACHDRLEADCRRTGWANWFLKTAFERFGESIAEVRLATVKSVLLDTFARHTSSVAKTADTLVAELRILFEYAADVHGLPNAHSISKSMNDALALQIHRKIDAFNGPRSGIGNAIGSLARDMGYDLTDPEQLNEFTETFNQRMAERQAASQQFMEPAGESFESSVPDPYVRYDERHKPQPPAPLGPSMTPEERKKFNRSRKKELGKKTQGDKRK